MDWSAFFPPETRVLALPSWRNPRFYLPTQDLRQRWEQSALYPASRLGARAFRLALRLGAAAGMTRARRVRSESWPLGDFVRGALPGTASAVILVGTPGPAQHITAQLRDAGGRVLGYLKYAEKPAALKRLRRERFMISNLPSGIGPEALSFGPLCDGEALLKGALPGKPLPATLPPPETLTDLLDSLAVRPAVALHDHPWVRRIREYGDPELDAMLGPLHGKDWPVVVQHGDFAPWNLLRAPDGRLGAIDWEYGTLDGFPYLDLAFYLLQTLALIQRRTPAEAARYTAGYLSRRPGPAPDAAEALALTRLAAYDAHQKSTEDGQPAGSRLQVWREGVWKIGGRDV